MSTEPDPKSGGKRPVSSLRVAALVVYVFALTILAKLYWPTREAPVSTVAPVTTPSSGQVPNN